MTSPTADTFSSSPRSIRIDTDIINREERHSPTIARSFDLNDQDALERQRAMDVDSAMQLSRARSGSIPVPPHRATLRGYGSNNVLSPMSSGGSPPRRPSETIEFPMLSTAEETAMHLARGEYPFDELLHDEEPGSSLGLSDPVATSVDPEMLLNHHDPMLGSLNPMDPRMATYDPHDPIIGSLGTHDPMLLGPPHAHSHRTPLPAHNSTMDLSNDAINLLPLYQPAQYHSHFDFSIMENFAAEQREANPRSPSFPFSGNGNGAGVYGNNSVSAELRRRLAQSGIGKPLDFDETPPPNVVLNDNTVDGTDLPDPKFIQRRQRKLSQSNPHPRRGNKLAMFESNHSGITGPLNGISNGQINPGETASNHITARPGLINARSGTNESGHDRPYRFSFYSNASSATIHARSLGELPAEGQTFEDLFMGRSASGTQTGSSGNGNGVPVTPVRTPRPGTPATDMSSLPNKKDGLLAKATKTSIFEITGAPPGSGATNTPAKGPTPGDPSLEDAEASTWWLDVLSPTDEEMRMLSKVFNIHPLTSEDIQMEETREKIELFRNYYFVCFRGFDQDIYSPTHLEPLNMYIIVFREGTLSFHFRGTPHPQNVRRRIKQLKDYINVTADWISYALIDDITDAFGPLIQSIEYEVDSIDELVLILKETEQSDMLRRIGTCRKKVMGLLRLMGNKADVVKGLAKRCNENWSVAPRSDIGLYLSDIQDHLVTMTQNLNHYEKILSRSHSNYLAQISIEMTDANNQINDVLSKLTALGTVLVPMNLITGLWGMNVHVPGQDIETGYTWFLSIIGGLVGFAVIGSILAYRLMVSR